MDSPFGKMRFSSNNNPKKTGRKGEFLLYGKAGKPLAVAASEAALRKLSAYVDDKTTPIRPVT